MHKFSDKISENFILRHKIEKTYNQVIGKFRYNLRKVETVYLYS